MRGSCSGVPHASKKDVSHQVCKRVLSACEPLGNAVFRSVVSICCCVVETHFFEYGDVEKSSEIRIDLLFVKCVSIYVVMYARSPF